MLRMKKVMAFVRSNFRQIIEFCILLIAFVVLLCLDMKELFREYLDKNYLTPGNFIYYFSLVVGVFPIVAFVVIWWSITKFNSDYLMNEKPIYHDYPYVWYFICANILRIRKCSLVLVPIFMQFKLITNSTFKEYPFDDSFPEIENEPDCQIISLNESGKSSKEVNLIIEDTYLINSKQLPFTKKDFSYVKISRNDGHDKSRHYSRKLIEATINTVRDFSEDSIVNVFATTNPMNTFHIVKEAFNLGDRGNIKHLYVFQQVQDGDRMFEENGHKIF